jgi:hypothetical protein
MIVIPFEVGSTDCALARRPQCPDNLPLLAGLWAGQMGDPELPDYGEQIKLRKSCDFGPVQRTRDASAPTRKSSR